MSDLPFVMSTEAATHIREELRRARESPGVSGMLPVLFFAHNSRTTDMEGRTLSWCPGGFFAVGWYRPEQVADHCLDEIDLGDEMVYLFASTLERLAGMT